MNTHLSPIVIFAPAYVKSNESGYNFLSVLAGETINIIGERIYLDFGHCQWFDGNLCSVMGCILESVKLRNNTVFFRHLSTSLRETFNNNSFLPNIQETKSTRASLSIPYNAMDLENEGDTVKFIEKELFDKKDMPLMDTPAKKAIIESLFEICVNALTHSDSHLVYVCGQFYPNAQPPRVAITFSDLGKTIKNNVNEHRKLSDTGNKTILWALEDGNTTKKNQTGGIGFSTLKRLVDLNEGNLQVVSSDGYIEYKNRENIEYDFKNLFPGTIVTLTILLNDPNFYYLETQVDLDNIFG